MSNASVLVVCLGNTCRSPIGEAVLKHVASKRGLDIQVNSAGMACYHVGKEPDSRALATLRKFGVPVKHEAQQVEPDHFLRYTHILAADESILRTLMRIKPTDSTAEVKLWGSYLDNQPIEDPYYGGIEDYENTYHQCVKLSNAVLDEVTGKADS